MLLIEILNQCIFHTGQEEDFNREEISKGVVSRIKEAMLIFNPIIRTISKVATNLYVHQTHNQQLP